LIGYAIWASRSEKIMGSSSALLFAVAIGLLGPILYHSTAAPWARRRLTAAPAAD
jgi:hypothetical protein